MQASLRLFLTILPWGVPFDVCNFWQLILWLLITSFMLHEFNGKKPSKKLCTADWESRVYISAYLVKPFSCCNWYSMNSLCSCTGWLSISQWGSMMAIDAAIRCAHGIEWEEILIKLPLRSIDVVKKLLLWLYGFITHFPMRLNDDNWCGFKMRT